MENCIFLMGKENTQKCVPNPFLTHDFHFLIHMDLVGAFASRFLAFSIIFPWMETCFWLAHWMGREIHDLGVCRGHFFPCNSQECFLKSIFSPKVDFPFYHFFLVAKTFFFIPNTCVLLLCAPLSWSQL